MLSIVKGGSASYLTDSVGSGMEGYYTGAVGAGEPAGRWWGTGAEQLGLVGLIDPDEMHEVYGRFADPRDPRFADPSTRDQAAVLGKPPKRFRTPDQVVADRVETYSAEYGCDPTPEQVRAWRVEAEARTTDGRTFYDATYSPQKSVTVLHAAYSRAAHQAERDGDHAAAAIWRDKVEQIDQAVWSANEAMLGYLSEHAGYARTGRHGGRAGAAGSGTGRWVDAPDLVVARFYQHTSREHDPQLHIHNAILNQVPCPDGKWRAIDSKALHRAVQGAGGIGSLTLRTELTRRLGVSWVIREDGHDFEIAGIDQHVLDLFSTRTRNLTSRAAELIERTEQALGRPLNSLQRARLTKRASLKTRPGKTHESESEDERTSRWDAQLQSEVAGGLLRTAQQLRSPAAPAARPWSADAVIAQALEAVHGTDPTLPGTGRAVWGRSDLSRQITLALPAHLSTDLEPADLHRLVEDLTDRAIGRAVHVSGRELGDLPCPDRLADGRSAATAPYAHRWASPDHLAAEVAVLQAAGIRGRHHVPSAELAEWLDRLEARSGTKLAAAQREAVVGLAGSDAALSVLVGPAGTGKSYTAGVLAAAWSDLTGGRVIGLATAETAARILADDGLTDSANIAAFLAVQGRLADGRPRPGDERWQVGARDILAIDEASMLDTLPLTRIQQVADAAGARVILMGDPMQLGSVGAGGMMRTLANPLPRPDHPTGAGDRTEQHTAEVYTLAEVRRFAAEWERDASKQLRAGNPAAVTEYARHGRLRDAGTLDQAVAAIAEAAAADRIAGHEAIVTCASNEDAAAVATRIRDHLVAAGLVEPTGVVLGRDQSTAGVGDLVQARRIDHTLGLINRHTYVITETHEDGSLTVRPARADADSGTVAEAVEIRVPADYVAADLTLGYASTVHAAQGATVHSGHALLTPSMDRHAAYPALTRGTHDNTCWAVTDSGDPKAPATTAAGLLHRILTAGAHPEAEANGLPGAAVADDGDLPADVLAEVDDDQSAHDHLVEDLARVVDPVALLERIEDQTRLACRIRLDADLDDLTAAGVISPEERARFGADQGSEHLARQLYALETAGHDPAEVLREAIEGRSFARAVSLARATSARIDKAHGLPVPASTTLDDGTSDGDQLARGARVPARVGQLAPDRAEYLNQLHAVLDQRTAESGDALAELVDHGDPAAPPWAVSVLGPVPPGEDSQARTEWAARAGRIELARRASGWTDQEIALGRCPGVSTPQKRLAWSQAWIDAGMPEERRPAADLTEGQIRVRVAAGERILAHAPAYVHDQQAAKQQEAADRRRAAVLARSSGDIEQAEELDAEAAFADQVAQLLDQANDTRSRWLLANTATLDISREARQEALRRRLDLTPRPSTRAQAARHESTDEREAKTTATHADDRADGSDDHARPVTEADVDDRPHDLDALDAPALDDDHGRPRVALYEPAPAPSVSAAAAAAEARAAAVHAAHVADQLADQASQDAHQAADDEWRRRRATEAATSRSAQSQSGADTAAGDSAGADL